MTLELYDQDPGTVLAIVAHPDDLEYGAAAAVSKWTTAGNRVDYLLVTRGEAGIDTLAPVEAARVRELEQRASAAIVGVTDVEFLDYPDGVVEYGTGLRRELAEAIRRYRPDTVLLFNHRDSWGFPGSWMPPWHRCALMAPTWRPWATIRWPIPNSSGHTANRQVSERAWPRRCR